MGNPPWYTTLVWFLYRVRAWLPVVHRYGTWWDLNDQFDHTQSLAEQALDALEHRGEDGIHQARSLLYHALDA